jgi:hypothetical protein
VTARNGKGNGHVPKTVVIDVTAPAPRYRKGQRVSRVGQTQIGIVRSARRGRVEVYWGTSDNREVVSTVPAAELEPFE